MPLRRVGERRAADGLDVVELGRDRREALPLGVEAGCFSGFRQLSAFNGDSDLARERLQQMPLLWKQNPPLIARQHSQYTQTLPQRQVQAGRCGQRIRAQTRTLAVVNYPLRDGQVGVSERRRQAGTLRILQLAC